MLFIQAPGTILRNLVTLEPAINIIIIIIVAVMKGAENQR
jgi:hypothetical protein